MIKRCNYHRKQINTPCYAINHISWSQISSIINFCWPKTWIQMFKNNYSLPNNLVRNTDWDWYRKKISLIFSLRIMKSWNFGNNISFSTVYVFFLLFLQRLLKILFLNIKYYITRIFVAVVTLQCTGYVFLLTQRFYRTCVSCFSYNHKQDRAYTVPELVEFVTAANLHLVDISFFQQRSAPG